MANSHTVLLGQIEEGLYNLGEGKALRKVIQQDVNGHWSLVMNFTDTAAPTTGDKAIWIRMVSDESAGIPWPAAMRTQSHASGQFITSPALVQVYAEAPASVTGAHAKFLQQALQVLRGQMGALIELSYTANATMPALNGVDGAGADVLGTSMGLLAPYGRSVPVGTVG